MSDYCHECRNKRWINMGPTERGGPNVSEPCPRCNASKPQTHDEQIQEYNAKHYGGLSADDILYGPIGGE